MDNQLVLILIMMLFIITTSLSIRIGNLKKEIYRMKTKLNRISEYIDLPDPVRDELKTVLVELVSNGEKIEAVKEYRKATGASLLEAKQYIDDLSDFKN